MALTAYGKNEALTGATSKMTWVALFTSVVKAPTAGTAIGASLINMTGSKAAGWVNNKPVVFRKLTAGVTGLIEGRTYFIVGEVTNGFEVALEEGSAAVKVTGAELLAASTEVALLTEVTGGTYKRVKATWGVAKLGEISDTAAETLKVPASTTITDAGWLEGESTGKLIASAKLEVPETFGAEGEYKVTSDKLESNALA